MNEEEKKAIDDSKDLINELNNHKDKDFIGRLYYKNKPIEENLEILLNTIERLQKENKTKDRIIDDMADWLYKDDTSFGYGNLKEVNTKERIVKFFENKTKQKQ